MADEARLVHVCRHGEVDNPGGVLYTRLPGFHLSERGHAMADRLGEHFADVPVAGLRTSPLERTQETMAPIAARHPDLDVVVDGRLLEADSLLQGTTAAQRRALIRDPARWGLFRNPLAPSWGEPWTHIVARMRSAIVDAALSVGPGRIVVLTSHQAPIWVTRLAAEHRSLAHLPAMRRCTLASVTTFSVTPDGTLTFVGYAEPARDLLP